MSDANNNNDDFSTSQIQRNRYFYGKLMTVGDFDTEQNYMNGKRHLLNRVVSGAGLIRGLGVGDAEHVGDVTTSLSAGTVNVTFKKVGTALDPWGKEIIVPTGDKPVLKEGGANLTSADLTAVNDSTKQQDQYYLYLEFEENKGEMVSSASENSSCDETCCANRMIEGFKIIASTRVPVNTVEPPLPNFNYNTQEEEAKRELKDWFRDRTDKLGETPGDNNVFLLALVKGSHEIDYDETKRCLSFVTNNRAFSELLASHMSDFQNPHNNLDGLKVEKVEGEETQEVDVDHYHGYITIEKTDEITLAPDPGNHKITIGETHSAKKNNPHETTAEQVGALVSVDGVDNPGGDVDLVQEGSITITPNNTAKTITFGETHSARIDNPHETTAEQVDALESVNGVRRDENGNVQIVNDNSITINTIGTDGGQQVKIGETHSAETENPHDVKMSQLADFDADDNKIINLETPTDNKDAANKIYVDEKDTDVKDYVDAREIAIKEYSDTKDTELKNYVDGNDTELKDYVDTREIAIKEYSDTKDTELKEYVDNQTEAVRESALSIEGGLVTGPIHVRSKELGALTGNATEFYGVMGRMTGDLETGSDYRTAGLVGVSEIEGTHGVYTKAPEGTHALYVQGSALFTGPKTGYVVDIFKNAGGTTLKTGDVVKLKGTAVSRFFGDNDKIPVAEVTLADKENDNCTIGIVDRKAIPEEIKKGKKSKAADPAAVKDGEELYVVTLGAYFRCKVDASNAPIKVGDLLTSSGNPGFAQKAVEPKIGSIIGKALEPLEKGTGFIAVFVNIQ